MPFRSTILAATLMATSALASAASAATLAEATIPLNVRSGPGPQYTVIGAIPVNGKATIIGCIQDSLWCQVSYNGHEGWAYAQYLSANVSGRTLVIADDRRLVPSVTYTEQPVTTGRAVAPPPRIVGSFVRSDPSRQPLVLSPPPTVQTYVVSHPIDPVYVDGEVVEGVGLPQEVAVSPVPGYDYDYAYVNSQPVLVDRATRRVTYVYR
jgi:uncharacterized protein YraI